MDIRSFTLQILRSYVNNEKAVCDEVADEQDWIALFQLASEQNILPLVYEAVYDCDTFSTLNKNLAESYKQQVKRLIFSQITRTEEFLELYRKLLKNDLTPMVVKGIICRSLYSHPDHRLSWDEDVFVPQDDYVRCHEIFKESGLYPEDREIDINSAREVKYIKNASSLAIELSRDIFPSDSDAYRDLGKVFDGAFERRVQQFVQEVPIYTLDYSDHMLYLILHAFKHFLHSGFGIRQVCDIAVFANTYGDKVDWRYLLEKCREVHADIFAAAVFKIGYRYLGVDVKKACYSQEWLDIEIDEKALLDDIMAGGVYGDVNVTRLNSSNITLNAVSMQRRGRRKGNPVLKSVFPSAKSISGRYKYLNRYPYLLPIAWVERILRYCSQRKSSVKEDAAESLRIGNRRVELLKKYGIIS